MARSQAAPGFVAVVAAAVFQVARGIVQGRGGNANFGRVDPARVRTEYNEGRGQSSGKEVRL
jgi:hypothetical protein